MRKEFIKRVIDEGIVDTDRYRYVYDSNNNVIKRLRASYLDTTRAIDGWKTVVRL